MSWSSRKKKECIFRGGSRTAAISKMELFVIIVNGFQPLTIITKSSILDVAAVLDPPLIFSSVYFVRRKLSWHLCFYLIAWCIEYTFRIYILLPIKKHYFTTFVVCFSSRRKPPVFSSGSYSFITDVSIHISFYLKFLKTSFSEAYLKLLR